MLDLLGRPAQGRGDGGAEHDLRAGLLVLRSVQVSDWSAGGCGGQRVAVGGHGHQRALAIPRLPRG